jgi:heavy metal sensor kinase
MTRLTPVLRDFWRLRTRITVWYILLIGITLITFGAFLHFRIQHSLLSQLDTSLEVASSQALPNLETGNQRLMFSRLEVEYIGKIESLDGDHLVLSDGTMFELNGETELSLPLSVGMAVEIGAVTSDWGLVALEIDEADLVGMRQAASRRPTDVGVLRPDEFAYRIVGLDGVVWDSLGNPGGFPLQIPGQSEFVTVQSQSGPDWRVHQLALNTSEGRQLGWLQTARSLEQIEEALGSLRIQLVWSIPLVIVLAASGGFFLADRGLHPINRITRLAQSITGSDLHRQINHRGPNDEVGRLARTFDAMLERLEATFERERRFTADASHELRTPLTALKGRLDVTLSKPRSPSEYQETLLAMEQEVDRLIRLSNALLFLARLEQGQLYWQPEVVPLDYLLRSVVDQVRPQAEAKGLAVLEDVPPGTTVYGDPDHLIRLFLGLLDNACKYTPPGGQITVRAVSNAAEISISIKDTGPGIPEEDLDHIFERFYWVDDARSRDSGGTGLGLAIAYEITQMHRGRLEVQSPVGGGTTFSVVLSAGPPDYGPALERVPATQN